MLHFLDRAHFQAAPDIPKVPDLRMEPFGTEFKNKHFTLLDPEVVPVNHGSYGTTPTSVIESQIQACREHEKYPDDFEQFQVFDIYKDQINYLATYLGLNGENLVLVSNATAAINTVLRSIPWDFSKDTILLHSTTYQACANTATFMRDYYGLKLETVDLQYPLDDSKVVSLFREKLVANRSIRVVMFDVISSMPGVKVPYEQLIKLCREFNVLSLIDGAHAVGQLDLTFLDTLQPDFFTSNLHKWLYVPKSVAMLYVNPRHHDMIQSMPVSWNYSAGKISLCEKFAYYGTASYASIMCIKAAIDFRASICGGEENIQQYQYKLRKDAVSLVKAIFGEGAELLENQGQTLRVPGMFNINLPLRRIEVLLENKEIYAKFRINCHKQMVKEDKAFVPIFIHNNKLWARFSVQVFNDLKDYKIAAESVKSVVESQLNSCVLEMNCSNHRSDAYAARPEATL